MNQRLLVWVWFCVKCGLLQWHHGPCHNDGVQTVKIWLDDEYLSD